MVWHESSKGHFEQPLGFTERPFCLFGELGRPQNREHWSIHAVASVAFDAGFDFRARFRDAWRVLHVEYPDLDATVDAARALKHYIVLDEAGLSRRVEDTFVVEESYRDAESLIADLRRTEYPTCHVVPTEIGHATLVIHSSHWRLDGFGAFHLLNRFLILASQRPSPTPTFSASNLTPTYEDIISYESPPSPEISTRITEQLTSLFSNLPSAGFLADDNDPATPPRGTHSIVFTATPAATDTFVQACKKLNISVTAAMQSALAILTFRHAGDEMRNRPLAITTPADLRRHIPVLQRGDKYATGIFIAGMYSVTRSAETFLARAQDLMREYARVREPAYLHDEVPEFTRQITQVFFSSSASPPVASTTMCSSFGTVDGIVRHDYGGEITLEGARVGVEIANRENTLHIWTFRGRLNISICWNEAFYMKKTVEQYLREFVEILEGELGVQMGNGGSHMER